MSDDHSLDRRAILGFGAALAAAPGLANAQLGADRGQVIPLWPGRPPGAPATLPVEKLEEHGEDGHHNRMVEGVHTPHIALVRPARPNGAAMLIIPGGGYMNEWFDKEGFDIADRFARDGVTSFVLRYRLPSEGWTPRYDVPLQDAQRAVRLIRAGAARFGIDPNRVCVMGFSAGGHLSASVANMTEQVYAPVDSADALSSRPNLSALMYPVIDMAPPFAHMGSANSLLGRSPSPELIARRSPQMRVTAETPPTFVVQAWDDPVVPVENSLGYLSALRRAKVRAEGHIFEEGGHGFALDQAAGKPVAAWPELFLAWAGRHGFLRPA